MKKIGSVVPAVMLAVVLAAAVFIASPYSPVSRDRLSAEAAQEEKIYSNAKLSDDFAGDRVTVVLTQQATRRFLTYEPKDFKEIGCAQVTELTRHTVAWVQEQLEPAQKPEKPEEAARTDIQPQAENGMPADIQPEAAEGMMVDVHGRGDVVAGTGWSRGRGKMTSPNSLP